MLDYGSEEFFDMTPKSFHSPQHTFAVYFSLLHSPPVSDTVAKYQQMHRASASSTVIREWELLVRRKKEWMNGWIFFVWWLTAEGMNGNFMETFFFILVFAFKALQCIRKNVSKSIDSAFTLSFIASAFLWRRLPHHFQNLQYKVNWSSFFIPQTWFHKFLRNLNEILSAK